MKAIWLLGGGGHARVTIDAIRSTRQFSISGILSDERSAPACLIDGVPTAGPISRDSIRDFGLTHAVIAIGDNRARQRIAELLEDLVGWVTVVHAHAYVAPDAVIAPGTLVCAGAIVQPGARIGRHAVLNTSCSVDHDCVVEAYAQVGPGAHLGGQVTVGSGAFIGIGASVLPQVTIGVGAIVGAGATVIRDVPAGATAVGVPARLIRTREGGSPER